MFLKRAQELLNIWLFFLKKYIVTKTSQKQPNQVALVGLVGNSSNVVKKY